MNPFAENLKTARKEIGYTQQDMADLLSIKLRRYQAWEEGRSAPNLFHLASLCEILHIDDLYLFISKNITENCFKKPNIFSIPFFNIPQKSEI